jgi:hypothetical protein
MGFSPDTLRDRVAIVTGASRRALGLACDVGARTLEVAPGPVETEGVLEVSKTPAMIA